MTSNERELAASDDSKRATWRNSRLPLLSTDPRRWVIVVLVILTAVLVYTDIQMSGLSNQVKENRQVGCYNAQAVSGHVPPVCGTVVVP